MNALHRNTCNDDPLASTRDRFDAAIRNLATTIAQLQGLRDDLCAEADRIRQDGDPCCPPKESP